MAEKLHDLKKNPMVLEAKGVITGVKSDRFYRSGVTPNGYTFNEINFGLNIAPRKTIYFKITGFVQNEVYYFEKVKRGEKGQTIKLPWKDRKKSPGDNYRKNGVNITIDRDEEAGKNVNEIMFEYDAVEYLHEHLKDGDSRFIRANLSINSFKGKDGNMVRMINFIPSQISWINPIDFDAEDFKEVANLETDRLVFESIEKETDENGKETGRAILNTYLFDYNSVETMAYIVDNPKLAKTMHKALKPGNCIHAYGNVDFVIDTSFVEPEDDGWGDPSPKEMLGKRPITEYIIYRCKKETLDKDTYSEDNIAKAIHAIRNAKEASKKFGSKDETVSEEDWGNDDSDEGWEVDDDSDPWD